jgi:hypothetical protein
MTLADRATRGARGAWRRVALPRLEVLAVDESELLERGEGLGRAAELTGRNKSVLTGAGSATPRRCIAERNVSSGVSVWRAFA